MTDTLGARLRTIRKKRGLTQAGLAKQAGVSITTVQRAEWGTFEPRVESVMKIANALQVSVDWMLMGKGKEPR